MNGETDKMTVVRLSDNVTIIRGDAYELVDSWPIDSALASDPPYGISLPTNYAATRRAAEARDARRHAWKGREHGDSMHGDDTAFDPTPFLRFKTLCLWGAQNYSDRLPARYSWLAWDKRDARGAKCHLGDAELAWCSGVPFNSVRMFHHLWIGYQRDSEVGEGSLHPTQKPIALWSWALETCGITSGLVIDPFMGSGSLGVACIRAGLKYCGAEIDPTHFATARARLEKELQQTLMPLSYEICDRGLDRTQGVML